VRKALLDSSTYFDLQRAPKNFKKPWAQATMNHAREYLTHYPRFCLSWASVFDVVDGYYRVDDMTGLNQFKSVIVPAWEVLYADQETIELAAAIYATLDLMGQRMSLNDTYIAASAIRHSRALVTNTTVHFERVQAAGFPLEVANWRVKE
jgi:predicted nucleic acid-binding protein